MIPLEVWTCQRAENLKKKSSKIPKINYAAKMVSAARRQIIGGGGGGPAHHKKRRRRRRGAAGAQLYPIHLGCTHLKFSNCATYHNALQLWNDPHPKLRKCE